MTGFSTERSHAEFDFESKSDSDFPILEGAKHPTLDAAVPEVLSLAGSSVDLSEAPVSLLEANQQDPPARDVESFPGTKPQLLRTKPKRPTKMKEDPCLQTVQLLCRPQECITCPHDASR